MIDFEMELFDRINVIKDTIIKNGEENFYLSFSGGKDSTILHYLLDKALPNNQIPRVYIDTGIEYIDIRKFVLELASKDKRFIIIKPTKSIKEILEKYGYPFKSKEHSLRIDQFNRGMNSNYIKKYISGYDKNGKPSSFVCPEILKYQFEERGKYNYSNQCYNKLKKEPAHKWQKENHKSIVITGMRSEEGGNRKNLGCVITSKGKIVKFHPLIKVDEEWENEFIKRYNIELCKLYYPPYNFERTGCKFCPYSLTLAKQLEIGHRLLPNETKQAEILWKYVYDEYRRLGYRLKKVEQIKLF